MGMWRLLDNEDGIQSWHYYDDVEKKTIIKQTQDAQPLLDINQRTRSDQTTGWKGSMHHVASIPRIVYEQMMTEIGYDYKQPMTQDEKTKFAQMLSSRDYLKLRTKEGRLA